LPDFSTPTSPLADNASGLFFCPSVEQFSKLFPPCASSSSTIEQRSTSAQIAFLWNFAQNESLQVRRIKASGSADALVQHLLELGGDFTFVGRQRCFRIGDE
jgi:curli biogenesis system outer membrane secretion channel CsgG